MRSSTQLLITTPSPRSPSWEISPTTPSKSLWPVRYENSHSSLLRSIVLLFWHNWIFDGRWLISLYYLQRPKCLALVETCMFLSEYIQVIFYLCSNMLHMTLSWMPLFSLASSEKNWVKLKTCLSQTKSPFSIITHSSSHPSTPSHPSSPSSTCITTPFPAIMSHLLISALSAYKWLLAVLRTCSWEDNYGF